MEVTFGIVGLFCAGLIVLLQASFRKDRSFSDYAVGGRSFGSWLQSMSFLNSWWPGGLLLSLTGMALGTGVVAFYMPIYSLLTVMLMYLMARRVWVWGAANDLKTQADLLRLRYNSTALSVTASVISVISILPWLVLGFKSLGAMFSALSFGRLSPGQAVACGVALILVRQVWTIRMGMRGLVISDMYQGVVAYIGGTALILGLIAWLTTARGLSLGGLDAGLLTVPGIDGVKGPLTLFSMILTGTIGGWCWPPIFVRLYTADSVRSMLRAGVFSAPLSMLFSMSLVVLGLLASGLPALHADPDMAWFDLAGMAAGPVGLGLAGTIMLAATMGGVDAIIQAMGTQVANDIVGAGRTLSYRASILTAKGAMVAGTALAAGIACLPIPHLSVLALLSYQGIIQVAVAQYAGLFWRRGTAAGGIAGTIAGFGTAVLLETVFHGIASRFWGLSSGVIGLSVNAATYYALAVLKPQPEAETHRVALLFADTGRPDPATGAEPTPAPSPVLAQGEAS
ncbi:sodium:solute symporter family protein [Gluconacetobacter tumulisoli]|uniref:Sodium:solute symporter family protein n=1 Tax=Gluconacetobacter tumulisoli TaxID=1286189 RepID=A0A7W4PKH9_9PROT|nr:sodium:solute symporter family protein [Gluconacetobacter tumulisoli]MBB2201412.1 sodium:solute symporter family protein [Gluconacetobacter tumulisoli]